MFGAQGSEGDKGELGPRGPRGQPGERGLDGMAGFVGNEGSRYLMLSVLMFQSYKTRACTEPCQTSNQRLSV